MIKTGVFLFTKENSKNFGNNKKDIIDYYGYYKIKYDYLNGLNIVEFQQKINIIKNLLQNRKNNKRSSKICLRKEKETERSLDKNIKKIKTKLQENKLLKTGIDDLNKILVLKEDEEINSQNNNTKTNNDKKEL